MAWCKTIEHDTNMKWKDQTYSNVIKYDRVQSSKTSSGKILLLICKEKLNLSILVNFCSIPMYGCEDISIWNYKICTLSELEECRSDKHYLFTLNCNALFSLFLIFSFHLEIYSIGLQVLYDYCNIFKFTYLTYIQVTNTWDYGGKNKSSNLEKTKQ